MASAEPVSMAFLFTDIVGSTALWERYPAAMPEALRTHDAVLEQGVVAHGGGVVHRAGDGMIASFPDAASAVEAAVVMQRELFAADWSGVGSVGVRMAVHRGDVVLRDGSPYGWALNFGSRFCDVGTAGQILVSASAIADFGDGPASGFEVVPVATVRLRDIADLVVVHQVVAPGLPLDYPALRDTGAPVPLPVPSDELVGRSADLALLDRLITSNRLVTLVGPPGVGTSRLAVELVNRTLGSFADGAAWVDLASGGPAAPAVAAALGVSIDGGRPIETLSGALRGRRVAIVLDRADLSVDEVRNTVESLLVAAPTVTVVCAGRSALGIPGEVVHQVAPLGPDDALLLVERRAGRPVVDDDRVVLRDIALELDGLPLALEIAAGAAASHSWVEVLDRLRAGDHRRQRPFADASVPVQLGLDELDQSLRTMLAAATVFAGPFNRTAFHQVCAPDLDAEQAIDQLGELVDRSLIAREITTDRTWFRLLRPIRDVVELTVSDDARRSAEERLERWAARFADDAAAGLRGPEERLWNRRITSQFGNLRAAFARSAARGDVATAASLATSLWDYGFMRFNPEYLDWSRQLVRRFPDASPAVLGPVHGVAALHAWIIDDLAGVAKHADVALGIEEDHSLDFDLPARLALISATVYSGAAGPPPAVYEAAAAHQRDRPEKYFHVNVETQNSVMARWSGDRATAVERAVRAVTLAREADNPSSIAFALWAWGGALADDDPSYAETHLASALELAREVENRWIVALTQMSLVSIRLRTSGPRDAAAILVDLLDMLVRGVHRTHLWSTLRLGSLVLAALGDDELAIQVAAWVRGVGLAMPPFPSDIELLDEFDARVRAERGPDWVAHMELMSSTWTAETASSLVRDALVHHLDTT